MSRNIDQNSANVKTYQDTIDREGAASAKAAVNMAQDKQDIAHSEKSLQAAKDLWTKQLANFNKEEKDYLQAINSLHNAVTVLKKHQGKDTDGMSAVARSDKRAGITRFLQQGTAAKEVPMAKAHVMLALDKFAGMINLEPSKQKKLKNFLQSGAPAYQSQSGEIFGILEEMKENFEGELKTAQDKNAADEQTFNDVSQSLKEQLEALAKKLAKDTQSKADADSAVVTATEQLTDGQAALVTDQQSLADLTAWCDTFKQDYAARTAERSDEMVAVSMAVQILNNDDAHDQGTRTLASAEGIRDPAAFVQVSMETKNRNKAAALLERLASKFNKPKLAALAVSAKLDAFTKVIAMIKKLQKDLKAQKEQDIKKKDFCNKGLNQNKADTEENSDNLDKENASLASNEEKLANTNTRIAELTQEIADANTAMKQAGQDREVANLEYQVVVKDQREVQGWLNQALNVLKGYYQKKAAAASLMQQPETYGDLLMQKDDDPKSAIVEDKSQREHLKAHEKNEGGNVAIAMITKIINEARALEVAATRDEEAAQAAYETFVKETNAENQLKNDNVEITQKPTKAKLEKAIVENKDQIASFELSLTQLASGKKILKEDERCDFHLKNFTLRQGGFEAEIEGLEQAVAILRGSNSSDGQRSL